MQVVSLREAFLLLLIIITLGSLYLGYSEEMGCKENGGVRLRPVWGNFQCYEESSLRRVAQRVP